MTEIECASQPEETFDDDDVIQYHVEIKSTLEPIKEETEGDEKTKGIKRKADEEKEGATKKQRTGEVSSDDEKIIDSSSESEAEEDEVDRHENDEFIKAWNDSLTKRLAGSTTSSFLRCVEKCMCDAISHVEKAAYADNYRCIDTAIDLFETFNGVLGDTVEEWIGMKDDMTE